MKKWENMQNEKKEWAKNSSARFSTNIRELEKKKYQIILFTYYNEHLSYLLILLVFSQPQFYTISYNYSSKGKKYSYVFS